MTMDAYNPLIRDISMPARIRALPISPKGYPVPWFVAWFDGVPDFRVADTPKIAIAHNRGLCWVCGQPRGRNFSFALGPMCSISRTISEPPSHRDCSVYSVTACPFLNNPARVRRDKDLPEDRIAAAGLGIKRNPACVAVWTCRDYKPFRAWAGSSGTLFRVGEPEEVVWYAEGRIATRAEVEDSIESGLPTLMELAITEGSRAVEALNRDRESARKYLPAL